MSKEFSSIPTRSFQESVRMLHGFFRERQNEVIIDMQEIDNFAQKEGLTFGYCPENGNKRNPRMHLEFLERQGAIELIEDDESSLVRLVDKEMIP